MEKPNKYKALKVIGMILGVLLVLGIGLFFMLQLIRSSL